MLKIISPKATIGVLGSGSWATALVKILTDSKLHVNWYVRDQEQAKKTKSSSRNPNYLSEVKFRPRRITVSNDINEVVSKSEWLVIAIPSVYLESELKKINQPLKDKIIVSGVKGFIPETQLIVGEHLHQHYQLPWEQFVVIGGPSHAEEIALERLSYLTLASKDKVKATQLHQLLGTSYLQMKISNDVVGIEYAATLKNVYALASGIAHGLGYGDNFQSVLISNSTREMNRFIKKISKNKRNINHSAYLGDLLVTAYSLFSRNRRFGNMIGRGYTVKGTQIEMSMIAEGYYASESAFKVSKKIESNTPIIDAVYQILYLKKSPKKTFKKLSKKLD
ncbi:NAD(P)H-dependent glycerol-3-phosphate dehydrogenase [Flavobacteriaceae bacterium]|jgi:glycerol-3-phosphate dehydrogenase (NAD(P)+)|nr:NAD(P)H-dependent glycerol-3-phosphate dehydrogenase [Flavobacteriaceae bacterium]MDC0874543.1 NAD(P)H-dependent glycerol-3-phosphate dehydrogenase [Flavobacteriaceae bacterium]